MKKWQFEKFKVEDISSDPNHPCLQIWLKAPKLEGNLTASCSAVLGPHFSGKEEQLMYEDVRKLIIKTLNGYGQIRFVIHK